MKFAIVLACLVALAVADKDAVSVRETAEVGVDSYNYAYETSNQISASQSGKLTNVGEPETGDLEVTGEYSYVAPDGTPIKVTYRADASGYHAESDVIPKA